MNWLVNNYGGATPYRDYQAGALSLVSGNQLATLVSNGDTYTASFAFIEQVSAGVSWAEFVVANGETYTVEWRTSTDGATFTAWAALTTATVAAFTATANNKLYIQVRYTRTSAGAPPIAIYGFVFRFTYVSTATSGRGYIEDTNCINDLSDLFKGMAESLTVLKSGAPAFDVVMQMPNLSTQAVKPIIYVSDIQMDTQIHVGCQRWEQKCRLSIGVKSMSGSDHVQAARQFSQIMANFSAMRSQEATFDFTYKGDIYVSAYLSQFGISAVSSQARSTITDSAKNEQYRVMVVSFTLSYQYNHLIE